MRRLAAIAVLAVSAGLPAWCFQNDPDQTKAVEGGNNRPPATRPAPLPPPPRRLPNKVPKLPGPNPVEELKRFQSLSPEQREKELAKLPPKRRENVEKQLARFDAYTPVQRERAFHQLELTQTLTPERRQAVHEAIKSLQEQYRDLPPRERRQALARDLYSDEMKQKWSPTELELIHGAFPNI
jgi:Protein of unknown function (DUF3106)